MLLISVVSIIPICLALVLDKLLSLIWFLLLLMPSVLRGESSGYGDVCCLFRLASTESDFRLFIGKVM